MAAWDDGGKAKDQEVLVKMQRQWLDAGHWLVAAEHIYAFTQDHGDNICEAMGPPDICTGASLAIACVPNPARIVCDIVKVYATVISFRLMIEATIAYRTLDDMYEIATMSDKEAYYGYYYARAAYFNTRDHIDWNVKALEALRTNMRNQHMEMKKQLQERHKDIANHVGEDIADAQNALGHAIVDAQNSIGKGIVDSQNALGKGIVDAQNANGQAIVDASNYITLQHNVLSKWLHENLCLIYNKVGGGGCTRFIGPLEEDQAFVPVELSWPEGQPTVVERLEQIQSALSLGAPDDMGNGSEITLDFQRVLGAAGCASSQVDALEGKFDLHSAKVEAVESKVDALHDANEDVQRKVDAVESKVDAIELSMKKIEGKLSKLLDLLAKE